MLIIKDTETPHLLLNEIWQHFILPSNETADISENWKANDLWLYTFKWAGN